MERFRSIVRLCGTLVVIAGFTHAGFTQNPAKPTEKIVFVRPDPVITTSSEGVRRSSNPLGGGVNSVGDPNALHGGTMSTQHVPKLPTHPHHILIAHRWK